MIESRIIGLQQAIYQVLQGQPGGVSEYGLFDALSSHGVVGFDKQVFETDFTMFQAHFLLFHTLYRLRDQLLTDGIADIDIHCLSIRLIEIEKSEAHGTTFPSHVDPLREYYLDLSHLEKTTEADVIELLDRFRSHFMVDDRRSQALEVLEMDEAASYDEIKAQYRRLVMEHHPDRGGDKGKLQLINEAMKQIKNHYS